MKIFITRQIPSIGIDLLRNHFDVEIYSDAEPLTEDMLSSRIGNAEGLLCLVTDPEKVMERAPRLQIISNHGVGYDNIDVAAATRRNIAVTNTPGVLTEATADFTWALLLAVARHVVEGDRVVRSGQFRGWDPLFMRGADIVGKTLGIIGAGRIGTAVAERAIGWKMNILYVKRGRNEHLEQQLNARRVTLFELLNTSDFVSIHLPLTPETKHFIGAKELKQMKPTAYLINTARGAIIDEQALVEALREKQIAGAALDVFEYEPALTPGLGELPNVVLAPHLGSATFETRDKMAEIAAKNIIRYFQGNPPLSIVNPEVLEQ